MTWTMVYRMFFLGCNFVSGLLCTLKPYKPKKLKPKKLFKNPSFLQPWLL